jgi:xanthine dehydrogenase YagR molybdenum-binding subunit
MRKKLGCGEDASLARAFEASGQQTLEETFQTSPIFGNNDRLTFQSFGAHFVEVKVNEDIGRIRVSRIVSVFDCGRIISPKTARSQFMGGIVFGIGQALLEELVFDPQIGRAINADLAGYLVPVHADVPDIDVTWIDKPDLEFNPLGCRGVGEIGITGVAAAIANAIYHATGVRMRELPLSPGKFLEAQSLTRK